ncbi:MAG TPA: NAD-dependent epimerase/dehydratase family protein [Gemmatimonadaceae bacterium]|nr:NAD-dependent epimerase/dehydratase family protein [Gemmatimonadaceae bacterium]
MHGDATLDDRTAADGERRVVVTGANGFIGRHVCAELSRAGWRVRALVRRDTVELPPGVERITCPSLVDESALEPIFASADAVVHLAGRAHVLHDRGADREALFHASNVLPTIACARTAIRARVRTFVFMSSVAAAAGNDDGTISDATPARPINDYGRSKLAAEEALGSLAAASSMRVVSLRPPMVFGPGMRGNPLRLFRLVASGLPLPLGALHNARTILYVENLASSISDVLAQSDPAPPRSYLVGDPQPVSTAELVRQIAAALSRRARLIPVPLGVLRAAARVGDLLGSVVPTPLDTTVLRSLAGSLVLDTAAFQRDFGRGSLISLEEGLRHTARWYVGASAGGPTGR